MKNKEKVLLYHHIGSLLKVGLPLSEVIKEAPLSKHRKLLLDWSDQIRVHHQPLSALLSKHKSFTKFESQMFHLAEQTGDLPEIAGHLERWIEKKIKFRNNLLASVAYPCLVLLLMPFFLNFHIWFTTGSVSKFLQAVSFFYMPIFLTIGTISFLHYLFLHKLKSRLYEKILYSLPLYGKILRNHSLIDIVLVMAISQRCGLSFLMSLQMAEGIVKSELFRQYLLDAMEECGEGRSMHYILRTFPYLDDSFGEMIKVGEMTGTIDEAFQKIYEIKTGENALQTKLLLIAISFFAFFGMASIVIYYLVQTVLRYIGMIEKYSKF